MDSTCITTFHISVEGVYSTGIVVAIGVVAFAILIDLIVIVGLFYKLCKRKRVAPSESTDETQKEFIDRGTSMESDDDSASVVSDEENGIEETPDDDQFTSGEGAVAVNSKLIVENLIADLDSAHGEGEMSTSLTYMDETQSLHSAASVSSKNHSKDSGYENAADQPGSTDNLMDFELTEPPSTPRVFLPDSSEEDFTGKESGKLDSSRSSSAHSHIHVSNTLIERDDAQTKEGNDVISENQTVKEPMRQESVLKRASKSTNVSKCKGRYPSSRKSATFRTGNKIHPEKHKGSLAKSLPPNLLGASDKEISGQKQSARNYKSGECVRIHPIGIPLLADPYDITKPFKLKEWLPPKPGEAAPPSPKDGSELKQWKPPQVQTITKDIYEVPRMDKNLQPLYINKFLDPENPTTQYQYRKGDATKVVKGSIGYKQKIV